MNKTALAPQTKNAGLMPPSQGILQRKCACGSHTSAGGECEECAKKKGMLQRKLTIGASDDPLEQEADRVADQVMAAPVNSAINAAPLRIQRFTGQASEKLNTAPASVDHVLASSGRPLEPAIRKNMEQRFGHDFSLVRIFTGGAAEQSALDMHANAYTVGKNIVFGAGQYVPETQEGQKLIAHELTHVIQQNASGAAIRVQRFAPCRHLLEADERIRVSEADVRDSLLSDVRRLGPAADAEFPVLGGPATPLRTEPPRGGSGRRTEVISPQTISSDIFGRADIAALNGTALELIEVKRAWFFADPRKPPTDDGIEFAEGQLLRQVREGNRAIRDVQQRWRDRGHPTDTVTSVRGMPMGRFTPQTPRRIGGTATSLAWCRDGVLSFKAIGDRDPEVFICALPTRVVSTPFSIEASIKPKQLLKILSIEKC